MKERQMLTRDQYSRMNIRDYFGIMQKLFITYARIFEQDRIEMIAAGRL
jgi:hypothetical protein